MHKDNDSKTKATTQDKKGKCRLIENDNFTWAGWPEQYPVPLFTWEELNQILEKNKGKIPENMWKERIKRKG